MANKGARKGNTPYGVEDTPIRREENRRRRAVTKQALREAIRDGELDDLALPTFRGTEGWLTW